MPEQPIYPWIVSPADDGMVFIREQRGEHETWPVVLGPLPGSQEPGFGKFATEMEIVEHLVRCRNQVEGLEYGMWLGGEEEPCDAPPA